MSDYNPVPEDVARAIATKFSKSMVVILCYDPEHQLTHTATYGASALDKEQAAAVGEMCVKAVGFHDDYDPAEFRGTQEQLADIAADRDALLEAVLHYISTGGNSEFGSSVGRDAVARCRTITHVAPWGELIKGGE